MYGQMMVKQLTLTSVLEFAGQVHGRSEIVSMMDDESIHRYTIQDCVSRVGKAANSLRQGGLRLGDRVATLALNSYRHLELYFAIPSAGYVCHTVNPKLSETQIEYIINHAEDRWIFVDPDLVDLCEKLEARLPSVERWVLLTDHANMPDTSLSNAVCYETLLEGESTDVRWPELDECTASGLCYTSGTTGNPKGVLYSHRSTVLHSYGAAMVDAHGVSGNDCVLPVVPFYHANAWGCPFTAFMVGAKLVLPGRSMGSAESLTHLINREGVSIAMGVPTVWTALLSYLERRGETVNSLKRLVCGGSAVSDSLKEDYRSRHNVEVRESWGMTEINPMATINASYADGVDGVRSSQGVPIFGTELKLANEQDHDLPWDGEVRGEVKVRGFWVCDRYYKQQDSSETHDAKGWLCTGDVASIDPDGHLHIKDRLKDVIKSGGEWISSIELESIAASHPNVAEAAVIGVSHPKWEERPLLIIVPTSTNSPPTRREIVDWFQGKTARWCIPDDVVVVESIPRTATGKISKLELRMQFADYTCEEPSAM